MVKMALFLLMLIFKLLEFDFIVPQITLQDHFSGLVPNQGRLWDFFHSKKFGEIIFVFRINRVKKSLC